MNIQGIHHVAYRCINAKQTVEFYQQLLDMDFQLAIAENKVPSTGQPDPYMHVFLFKSIYCFDPNGHRLELAVNTSTAEMLDKLHTVAPAMLDEWDRTKRAPQHAAWLHDGTLQ